MLKKYNVGEHLFAIDAERELFDILPNYTPFETDELGATHVFIIHVTHEDMPSVEGWESVYTDRSDEDMPRIEMYRRAGMCDAVRCRVERREGVDETGL